MCFEIVALDLMHIIGAAQGLLSVVAVRETFAQPRWHKNKKCAISGAAIAVTITVRWQTTWLAFQRLNGHLAEEGVGSAVEVPLLRARLLTCGLCEGVQHLVRVDQVLVVDRRREVAPGASLL